METRQAQWRSVLTVGALNYPTIALSIDYQAMIALMAKVGFMTFWGVRCVGVQYAFPSF